MSWGLDQAPGRSSEVPAREELPVLVRCKMLFDTFTGLVQQTAATEAMKITQCLRPKNIDSVSDLIGRCSYNKQRELATTSEADKRPVHET